MKQFSFCAITLIGCCSLTILGCGASEKSQDVQLITTYYENGSVKSEVHVVDSVLHGQFKDYYPDGMLRATGNYQKGMLSGPVVSYHPNGALKAKEIFFNDILNGYCTYYFDNGNIEYEGKFFNDKKVGTHKEYYLEKDRALKSIVEYVIVGDKNIANWRIDYDFHGNETGQSPFLKIKPADRQLLVEVVNKEYKNLAVVLCGFDRFFSIKDSGSCDTIYFDDGDVIALSLQAADTVRGMIVNYEWINQNQTISKDLFFSYPAPW